MIICALHVSHGQQSSKQVICRSWCGTVCYDSACDAKQGPLDGVVFRGLAAVAELAGFLPGVAGAKMLTLKLV